MKSLFWVYKKKKTKFYGTDKTDRADFVAEDYLFESQFLFLAKPIKKKLIRIRSETFELSKKLIILFI